MLLSAALHAAVKPLVGVASYYGKRHQGQMMANGHHFDRHKLTAACRQFRLGTWVRVTSLFNHKSVVVQITDRGPGRKSRLIDLSETAARKLGLVHRGLGRVRVEEISHEH